MQTVRRYTRAQAEEIALRGVDSCYKSGYRWERVGDEPDKFIVTKPNGEEYTVFIGDGGKGEYARCNCPFCDDGWANPTCKHIAFVRDGLDADEWVAFRELVHDCMENIRREEEADAQERYGFRSGVIIG